MKKIALLSECTIDKIAAGEVVERPQSIVKELTENAIDAGATSITVEIKDGGISLIRVTDNGSGIEREDIKTAFLRHATSKIQDIKDLETVKSLGFRGEALSSIAAVSQVELISKTEEALTGVRYAIDGGKEKMFEDIGAPTGTTILMRNIFFNTPVRKKFLKSAATEGSYISDLMEHMALSNPYVSFKYVSQNQEKFHTSGNGDLKEIIYRIYGKETVKELLPVFYETSDICLTGYIGKPVLTRANRNFETYFINGRYMKSQIIAKAIEEAYKPYMMQHKYPFVVLHISFLGILPDVNVHPNKMDVRFENPMIISEFIIAGITDALKEKELIPDTVLTREKENPKTSKKEDKKPSFPEPFETSRIQEVKLRENAEYKTPTVKDACYETILYEAKENESILQEPILREASEYQSNPAKLTNIEKATESEGNPAKIKETSYEQTQLFDNDKFLSNSSKEDYEILGQIFDTYWLVAFREKLYMIDQHAAHEKVLYEKIVKNLKEDSIVSQNLVIPIIITVSAKEEAVLKQYETYFSVLGFEIEAFGGNEYALRSVPVELFGKQEKEMFLDILDELSEGSIRGNAVLIEEKLASKACKAAVKGNQNMTKEEATALIEQLLELENPYHCPHGRPTIISMSKYEIEKKFKRIV